MIIELDEYTRMRIRKATNHLELANWYRVHSTMEKAKGLFSKPLNSCLENDIRRLRAGEDR